MYTPWAAAVWALDDGDEVDAADAVVAVQQHRVIAVHAILPSDWPARRRRPRRQADVPTTGATT